MKIHSLIAEQLFFGVPMRSVRWIAIAYMDFLSDTAKLLIHGNKIIHIGCLRLARDCFIFRKYREMWRFLIPLAPPARRFTWLELGLCHIETVQSLTTVAATQSSNAFRKSAHWDGNWSTGSCRMSSTDRFSCNNTYEIIQRTLTGDPTNSPSSRRRFARCTCKAHPEHCRNQWMAFYDQDMWTATETQLNSGCGLCQWYTNISGAVTFCHPVRLIVIPLIRSPLCWTYCVSVEDLGEASN